MNAQVVCHVRAGVTLNFRIKDQDAVVGRDPAIAISVPVEGVSRQHAKIRWDGKAYWLEDLKSTNGTFLNGQTVVRQRLKHLDVIGLGKMIDLVFLVRTPEAAAAATREGIVAASLTAEGEAPIEIVAGEMTLGRATSNNVVAESSSVSKVHARIERSADQLLLEDLGSANGTFLNGARIMTAFLKEGDVLSLAGVETYRVSVTMGEIKGPATSPRMRAPAIPAERQRFAAEWKTRFEWDSGEREALEDLRRAMREKEKEREAQKGKADGGKTAKAPTAGKPAPGKPAAPAKPAAAAAAAAKPAAPAPAKAADATPAKPATAAAPPAKPAAPAAAAPAPPPAAAAPPKPAAPPAPKAPTAPAEKPAPAPAAAKPVEPTVSIAEKPAAPAARPTAPPPAKPPGAPPAPTAKPVEPTVSIAEKPAAPAAKPPAPAAPKPPAAPAAPPPTVAASPATLGVQRPTASAKTTIQEVRLSSADFNLSATETGAHELGRANDAALRVNHPTVSRKHARIILADDRTIAYLQDAGGANGTRLNGKAIDRLAPLSDGDKVGVGEVELTVALRRG